MRQLLERHKVAPAPPRERVAAPLSEEEAAFAAKLDPGRAARFGALDRNGRAVVMRAVKDEILRAHAVALIGPAPDRGPAG
jgi:hypothetical protein